MAEFFLDYGLFFLKALTIVIAIGAVIAIVVSVNHKSDGQEEGQISISKLNEELDAVKASVKSHVVDDESYKLEQKQEKKRLKEEAKARKKALKASQKSAAEESDTGERKKRVYVLDFDGDIRASAVTQLRKEITAVLQMAESQDEVVVKVESGGGLVHAYGLAASQLQRIRGAEVPLTVCVDKVAASGGYMMACVADKILGAPFAVLGSIGVVAQVPNVHKLLKKNDVDFDVFTAGKYKRTLTMLGENTPEGREKFQQDLEDTHELFKAFVTEHRPQLDMDEIATGEIWFGRRALDQQLIDEITTSDEYLVSACETADVYLVKYQRKKTLPEKLGLSVQLALDNVVEKWWTRVSEQRLPS